MTVMYSAKTVKQLRTMSGSLLKKITDELGLIGICINDNPHGSMYQDDNVVVITISEIDSWVQIVNFSAGECGNGITFNANTLVLDSDCSCTSAIMWNATIENGKDSIFEMAISINDAIKVGTKSKAFSNIVDMPYALSSASPFLCLTANDIIKLEIRNRESTDDVTITHATVTILKAA